LVVEVSTGAVQKDLLSQNFELEFDGTKSFLLGFGVVVGINAHLPLGLQFKDELVDPCLLVHGLLPQFLELLDAEVGVKIVEFR